MPFSAEVLPDELFQRCLLQLDATSQARVQRFRRRQDAWRSLIGMLLPRAIMKDHNISQKSVTLTRTSAGKPFIDCQDVSPAIGFNITHDSDVVAMISRLGEKMTVNTVGIDIMKRALPKGETVGSFLRSIENTLTQSELGMFTPELDTSTAVQYIFTLWTLKEAYTKALGLGLGFDFKRIDYDIAHNSVTVDGDPTLGWNFLLFEVQTESPQDVYQGAAVSWVGGDQTSIELIPKIEEDPRFSFKELSHLLDG